MKQIRWTAEGHYIVTTRASSTLNFHQEIVYMFLIVLDYTREMFKLHQVTNPPLQRSSRSSSCVTCCTRSAFAALITSLCMKNLSTTSASASPCRMSEMILLCASGRTRTLEPSTASCSYAFCI
ncbi:hypothetical protein SCLCIDRAFT_674996 [Scleroderma citrinum Foug A]|uniref:Uncharacterized protein n=1 Tax=Scleroderma citrinum Foug A TaxID=1036808 RepID=A0A0C3DTK0_9AGAM|nr:hypothetical protein SCLCIDRAFT_674996 [Scleroderma citrinum Foug A]